MIGHLNPPYDETCFPHPQCPDRDPLDLCPLSGACSRADRADHGRRAADFLLPRALGVDGFHSLLRQFWSLDSLSDQAPAGCGYGRAGQRRGRCCFSACEPGDWADLGASGVGHLVDLGLAPDLDAGYMAHLRQLPYAAPLLVRWPDAHTRCRAGGAGRALYTVCLLFDLVLPHPAPTAGHRRRRLHRSAHDARATNQLAGVCLLRLYGLLVALSPRKTAA